LYIPSFPTGSLSILALTCPRKEDSFGTQRALDWGKVAKWFISANSSVSVTVSPLL